MPYPGGGGDAAFVIGRRAGRTYPFSRNGDPMSWRLWLDRTGRFSFLRAGVLAGLTLPLILLTLDAALDRLGPRPYSAFIHQTGLWAFRFLLLSLLITPLSRLARWPRLMTVRRMTGVAACLYALVHLGGYAADQSLDLGHVAAEIARRFYLTIGFVSLVGLAVLGITSSDAMVRRLGGPGWRRLHSAVYALSILACAHFFLQAKADVTEPTIMAGLLALLLGYRLLAAAGDGRMARSPAALAALAGACALLTALAEAAGYHLVRDIPVDAILAADLSFDLSIRPPWWVLAGGGALLLAAAAGRRPRRDRRMA